MLFIYKNTTESGASFSGVLFLEKPWRINKVDTLRRKIIYYTFICYRRDEMVIDEITDCVKRNLQFDDFSIFFVEDPSDERLNEDILYSESSDFHWTGIISCGIAAEDESVADHKCPYILTFTNYLGPKIF